MNFHAKTMLLVSFSIMLFSNAVLGTVTFTDPSKPMSIGLLLEYLEDPDHSLTPETALQQQGYQPSRSNVPNFQTSFSTFWLKFDIQNNSSSEMLLLQLRQPIMDEAHLYTFQDGQLIQSQQLGEIYPFDKRTYNDPDFIFDLNLPKGEQRTYLLMIRSKEIIQVPLFIGTKERIFESTKSRDILSGVYIGIMLVMILYNLFVYFSVRDKSYLYYVGYIVLVLLTQTSLQGYPFQYLWPNLPWLSVQSTFLFPALVGSAAMEFMKVFTNTKTYTPKLHRFSFVFLVAYGIGAIMGLFGKYHIALNIINVTAPSISVYMLVVATIIVRKGYRPARFFIVAWSFFLVGVIIYVLKDVEVLPFNNLTRYMMHVGSGIETILLSIALADRINILKRERAEARERELALEKQNAQIMKEQNIQLEAKVAERTAALEASNKELKETQSQLVNSEKLASLGQLTAGIAHELNNPINFVVANVNPLKRDIQEVLQLLERCTDVIEQEKSQEEKLKEINQIKEEMDIDYTITEIEDLLQGIHEGANRTADIVKGLRDFARIDTIDVSLADINEGIDSTLALLQNKTRDNITVVKDFAQLEDIECFPSKLNQVFMNILNNAVQALDAKGDLEDKKIFIQTRDNMDHITIKIKDNGIGMDETTKSKVFDPFFTTKKVGEGTGMGMSITHGLIQEHHGTIAVQSEPNVGTEFTITLPKKRAGV